MPVDVKVRMTKTIPMKGFQVIIRYYCWQLASQSAQFVSTISRMARGWFAWSR